MNIIGEVDGRNCVIMDDMVDTAGTLCKAAEVLKERGAQEGRRVLHAPGAVGRRRSSASRTPTLDEMVVTDTIPLSPKAQACAKIRQLSCAQLLAETMTRISNEESVSSLFTE